MRRTKQEIARLKEWAKLLYTKDNRSQKEIAEIVDVTPKTITDWKQEGKWDELKKSLTKTREEQLQELNDQLDEILRYIKNKPEGQRFPNSKESDVIKKLTSSIKDLTTEIGIAETIDVFMAFSNWIRSHNFTKAQEVAELMDGYVQSRL